VLPGAVDDRVLKAANAHRLAVDAQHTRRLARRGTNAARELGEIVRRIQHRERAPPVTPVHKIVEVRDDVVDRAAVVAKRRAAIHAARPLRLGLFVIEADDEFLVVQYTLGDGCIPFFDALVFHEAGGFSHGVFR